MYALEVCCQVSQWKLRIPIWKLSLVWAGRLDLHMLTSQEWFNYWLVKGLGCFTELADSSAVLLIESICCVRAGKSNLMKRQFLHTTPPLSNFTLKLLSWRSSEVTELIIVPFWSQILVFGHWITTLSPTWKSSFENLLYFYIYWCCKSCLHFKIILCCTLLVCLLMQGTGKFGFLPKKRKKGVSCVGWVEVVIL